MARITCEDCLDEVGDDNRFNLIHLAVKRIRQHRKGEPYLTEGKNQEIVMTLREIADGKVTFENIEELPVLFEENDDNDFLKEGGKTSESTVVVENEG
ncbi:MAG: DNA-directed RNA polymerase subunit omega [Deltaproteobacteria bacterium]|nr:MAG: DNA-directed RNA polymerase subunit omega [Deltaproteobacteria bacterium]PIE72245.1 MAG: DNA-directed RNA polymerase subunit omega [Deltaproteobacteria bacterium]